MNCVICEERLQGSQRKYCSNKCKQKAHYHRVKEQPNTYHNQTIRAYKRKREIVLLKGGSCQNCGYDKNYAALEFHHVNSNEKEFNLDARRLANTSMKKLKKEVSKCLLLCSNCHREIHNPESDKERMNELLTNCE